MTEAVAIRTVAERRLGQILAEGARPVGNPNFTRGEELDLPTRPDLGVSGKLSARAAKLAERVIVQANPPGAPRGGPPDRGQSSTEGTIEPSTLRNMRQAHAGLTDERAEPSGTPVASLSEGKATVSHTSVTRVCNPVTRLW